MFRYYLKIALRQMRKNKSFTVINIAGLAIGLASFILIMNYVIFETSYEDCFKYKNNLFRLTADRYENGEFKQKTARTFNGIGKIIKAEIPDVVNYTHLYPEICTYKFNDKIVSNQKVYWADDSFLDMFDIKMLQRGSSDLLVNGHTLVLTKSAATRIFGDVDPIGKSLIHNEGMNFIVTGVCEELPRNTHLNFDILLSWQTLIDVVGEDRADGFRASYAVNLFQTTPNSNRKEIEKKIKAVNEKHLGFLKERKVDIVFSLQPIKDIHLKSSLNGEISQNGNILNIYFMLIIAIAILVMAWINFINLTMAKSIERGKEVGVYKVFGVFRWQIMSQFLFESLVTNLMALGGAILIISFILPVLNLSQDQYFNGISLSNFYFWITVLPIILVCNLIAGLLPAFFLSSFSPATILKGRYHHSKGGTITRKWLVAIQFTAAIVLLFGTFTIYRQISFVNEQNLGFNEDQLIILNSPRSMIKKPNRIDVFNRYKQMCLNNAAIHQVSASNVVPGSEFSTRPATYNLLGSGESGKPFISARIDRDFFKTLNVELAAGRIFSDNIDNNRNDIIINQTAAKMLGFRKANDAVNQTLIRTFNENQYRIIGIVNDYHQFSLKRTIEPMVYFNSFGYEFGYYIVKFDPTQTANVVSFLAEYWKCIYPEDICDYYFMNDFFGQQYNADRNFAQVWNAFALIAVVISCLGIGGLALQNAVNRTKEIGIRKVCGASLFHIIWVLIFDFVTLVAAAVFISLPISWYAMNKWLQNFAYRIDITIWHFIIAGLAALIIALLTVSSQAIRAAMANPVEALRYE